MNFPTFAAQKTVHLWDLGLAYSASGQLPKGEEWRQKAIALDPGIAQRRGGGGR